VLVLAVASAIANLEVKYDANGLVVRTGWARSDGDTAQNGVSARPANGGLQPASTEFQTLDRRLRDLEAAAASQSSAGGVQTASARMDDAEMLRRVRQIVGEAESRQQTVVAQQLLQVVRDFDRQRATDLTAIQQGLGTYQGLTNAEIAQQRDMLNQLYRVAARQEK
jgi:aspartate/tyrosine/aromatic aminotransferase